MRVGLVTIPPIERMVSERNSYSVPLGALCLAAIGEQMGQNIEVIDLTKLVEHGTLRRTSRFSDDVASYLSEKDLQIVCFTTMCSSYPVSLTIAEKYKEKQRDATVIFGGVQATATDHETMKNFGGIDIIVRGEGELTFRELLGVLPFGNFEGLHEIRGITYREQSRIVRTSSRFPIENLDDLPLPAYHLYPYTKDFKELTIEIGRACPFACNFCSTSVHWGRKARFKTADRVIREIKHLVACYNVNRFFFLHDCASINRKLLLDLGKKLEMANMGVEWRCHVRADHMQEGELKALKAGHLEELFCGMESGSNAVQVYINKNLELTRSVDFLKQARSLNIACTVSFIIGFPNETKEDIEQTLSLLARLVLLKCNFALYTLVPLANTHLWQTNNECLGYDGYVSDQIWVDMLDISLIRQYKSIFPEYYYIKCAYLSREFILATSLLFSFLYRVFPSFTMSWKYVERRALVKMGELWSDYCMREGIDLRSADAKESYLGPFASQMHDFLVYISISCELGEVTSEILRYELAKTSLILEVPFEGNSSFMSQRFWLGSFNHKISHLKARMVGEEIEMEIERASTHILIQHKNDSLRTVCLNNILGQYLAVLFQTTSHELALELVTQEYQVKEEAIRRWVCELHAHGVLPCYYNV